jgi:hypothetical protein
MAAIRVQCAFRAHRARKQLKRLQAARAAAVKMVRGVHPPCGTFPTVRAATLGWAEGQGGRWCVLARACNCLLDATERLIDANDVVTTGGGIWRGCWQGKR